MSSSTIDNYIQLSGALFEEVQRKRIYPDSKYFVDMVPKTAPQTILEKWNAEKTNKEFDLKLFIESNFDAPESSGKEIEIDQKENCRSHIKTLWPMLFREVDTQLPEGSSLLPLPKPYVVPGGRFREIYYWDSYFTAQGLQVDGHEDMVLAMTENFRHLIETFGHIPNGNRAYYLSRSQPPFFTPMVVLVISMYGDQKIAEFLPAVEKEYSFWMDQTGEEGRRLVKLIDGKPVSLNRYWDDLPIPRQESWVEDVEAAKNISPKNHEDFYRNIRAACESGWDFTSRWFADNENLSTIETTNILPIDLNTLLWFMEVKLSEWYKKLNNSHQAENYSKQADLRAEAIQTMMWNEENGFFFDYHHIHKAQTNTWSLAGIYPLYFGLAKQEQADRIAVNVEKKFLKGGGLLTTAQETGQQWDAPNGWAPLQWLAIKGLEKYGHNDLAKKIQSRWLKLNEIVYQQTGKMVEKYNVVDLKKEGGGGEYPLQDGFGWSNGVYSALHESTRAR